MNMFFWELYRKISVLLSLILFTIGSSQIIAQPTAAELADRLDQVNLERIQNIDQLQITNVITSGMMEGMENVTNYEKVQRNGRDVLEAVDSEDDMYEMGDMTGYFDEMMGEMVRHASSVSEESYQGNSVYRIEIDDREFLNSLAEDDRLSREELDEDFAPESVVLLMDTDELILYRATFYQQSSRGDSITMHINLSEYEYFSGLPIPLVVDFEIEGLDQMISEEEMAEARDALREMESQLEQMPEAQRNMIEQQLRPQIERFEQMVQQGELGNMRIEVTNVVVN